MKILLDTNVYVSWIRAGRHEKYILKSKSIRYLSSVVLMELWAGSGSKKSIRLMESFQKPYFKSGRVITPAREDYISAGQIISNLTSSYGGKVQAASFVNDILIALSTRKIGALLVTENQQDFNIIGKQVRGLKMEFA